MVGPGAVLVRPVHEGDHARRLSRASASARGRSGWPPRRRSRQARGPAAVQHAARQRPDRRDHRPARRRARGRRAARWRSRWRCAWPASPSRSSPDALAAAFPDATPRIVVFVHGLMTTEFSWALGGRERYGDRLAREIGCTPVYVRYNTGRHISENGRSLSELMERARGRLAGGRRRRSRSWATRWAGSWRAAPAVTPPRTTRTGRGSSSTASRSARRTWARRSSRRCTC